MTPTIKAIVATVIAVTGAIVIVTAQLQTGGIELPGRVAIIVAIATPLATYLAPELNPSRSAVKAARWRGL